MLKLKTTKTSNIQDINVLEETGKRKVLKSTSKYLTLILKLRTQICYKCFIIATIIIKA